MKRICLACLLLLLPAASARAEVTGGESIGWLVADSVVIVRGTMSEVWTTKGKHGVSWDKATLNVSETLKGKDVKHVTFNVGHWGGGETALKWKEQKADLLFFLVGKGQQVSDDRGIGVTGLAMRKQWGQPFYVVLGNDPKSKVFTTDFKVLTNRDAILTAVRSAVAAQQGKAKPKNHYASVPISTEVFRALWSGSSVFLIVPADDRLEKHAQEWINSKDFELRLQGAEALRHFNSSRNIELLKSLLNDPDFSTTSNGDGQNRRRVYNVRKSAFDTLKSWGVEVEKPVVEERLN